MSDDLKTDPAGPTPEALNQARQQLATDQSLLAKLIAGEIQADTMAAGMEPEQRKALIMALMRAHIAMDMGGMSRLADLVVSWRKVKRFETNWDNVPGKLMLIVTDLAKAMEAFSHLDAQMLTKVKDANAPEPEDKQQLGVYENFVGQLASATIRLMDLMCSLGMDIGTAVALKMAGNWLLPPRPNK
jgi:hypothetical protein